jgi:hypothetical protein
MAGRATYLQEKHLSEVTGYDETIETLPHASLTLAAVANTITFPRDDLAVDPEGLINGVSFKAYAFDGDPTGGGTFLGKLTYDSHDATDIVFSYDGLAPAVQADIETADGTNTLQLRVRYFPYANIEAFGYEYTVKRHHVLIFDDSRAMRLYLPLKERVEDITDDLDTAAAEVLITVSEIPSTQHAPFSACIAYNDSDEVIGRGRYQALAGRVFTYEFDYVAPNDHTDIAYVDIFYLCDNGSVILSSANPEGDPNTKVKVMTEFSFNNLNARDQYDSKERLVFPIKFTLIQDYVFKLAFRANLPVSLASTLDVFFVPIVEEITDAGTMKRMKRAVDGQFFD